MTRGDGSIEQVKNAIIGDVAKRLADKGIYQDERGSWQIRGLERNDPSLQIRDMAVAGMGGPSWQKIVADADARLGAGNIGLGRSAAADRGPALGTTMANDIIAQTNQRIADRVNSRMNVPATQTTTPGGTPTIPGRAGVPTRTIYNPATAGTSSGPVGRTTAVNTLTPSQPRGNVIYNPATAGTSSGPVGRGTAIDQLTQGTVGQTTLAPGTNAVYPGGRGTAVGQLTQPPTGTQGDMVPRGPLTNPATTTGSLPQDTVARTGTQGDMVLRGPLTNPATTTGTYPQDTVRQGGMIDDSIYGQAVYPPPQPGPATGPYDVTPLTGYNGQGNPYPPQSNSYMSPNSQLGLMYQQSQQPQGGMPGLGMTPITGGTAQPGLGMPPITGGTVPMGQGGVTRQGTAQTLPPGQAPPPQPQVSSGRQGTAQTLPPGQTPAPGPTIPQNAPIGSQPIGTFPSPPVTPARPVAPRPGVTMGPGGLTGTLPNGRPFGGTGNPMVDQIQAYVAQRMAGQTGRFPGMPGGAQMPGGGQQPGLPPALQGLGDRIRGSVQGGLAGMPGRGSTWEGAGPPQTAGQPGLAPGGIGNTAADIMSRVQGQLAQMRMPGGRPDFGANFPFGAGGGPGQMTMPGGPGTGMPTTGTAVPPGGPTTGGTGGTLGSYGNQSIDQWDQAFIAAGNKYNVDPTLLKAMMEIESGGDGNYPLEKCRSDGSCGPMQVKPDIWGYVGSVPEQIEQAAKILGDAVSSGQYPNAEAALFGIYFPTDDVMNGTTQGMYADKVHQLQAQMGPYQPAGPGTGQPTTGQPGTGGTTEALPQDATINPPGKGTSTTTDPVGMNIADHADDYVGTAYVWGGGLDTPEGPSPGNWDCSGFVKYMSDHFGDGSVPSTGSHQQYTWAAQTGRLKQDPALVQPGDMIFFDTAGGGEVADGNTASHVGIYIGNGRMIHAAHACQPGEVQGRDCGVIESDFNHYLSMYPYLGSSSMF